MTEGIERSYPAKSRTIAQQMHRCGLSIRALSEKAIISTKTIGRLLKGERAEMETYQKLAKVLGVPIDELFETTLDKTGNSSTAKEGISALLRSQRQTNDKDTDAVAYELLQMIAERIQHKGVVVVIFSEKGSVLARLLFTEEHDVHSLIRAFCSLQFQDLEITYLQVPSYLDIYQDIIEALEPITRPADLQELRQRNLTGSIEVYPHITTSVRRPFLRSGHRLTINNYPTGIALRWAGPSTMEAAASVR